MRRCGRDLCRIDECGTEPYSKHRKGAAFATAAATVGATRGSRGLAMMLVSLSSKSGMRDAMAPAAAIFISSLISLARTSSAPRKMPGKARRLLT